MILKAQASARRWNFLTTEFEQNGAIQMKLWYISSHFRYFDDVSDCARGHIVVDEWVFRKEAGIWLCES